MFWVIILSFFCVLGYLMLATNPGNKLIQSKNTRRHLLDFCTAYVGGFLFVVIVRLFESGRADSWFSLKYILNSRKWEIGSYNLSYFIFAFIVTYIIIFIRHQYKKT